MKVVPILKKENYIRLRSLAIGLCLCGAGVGTFVLAPVEQYLTGKI